MKGKGVKNWIWEKVFTSKSPWRWFVFIFLWLLYLISPFDLVPDAIPGLGLVDDVSLLIFIITRFVIWLRNRRKGA